MPRRLQWAAAVGVVLMVGPTVWLLWPEPSPIPGAGRVRQYRNVRACLLTGAGGVGGGPAAQAWSGMEDASASTRAMVSYLPVTVPLGNVAAVPFVATLAERQCRVIVAVGRVPVAAVTEESARFPQVRFVAVAGRAAGRNIVPVAPAPASRLRAAVEAAVLAAIRAGPAA